MIFLVGRGEGRGKGLRSYYDGKKLTQSYRLLLSRYVTISWIFFFMKIQFEFTGNVFNLWFFKYSGH